MTQASEKQVAFIFKLLKEKDINKSSHAVYLVAVNSLITSNPDGLTKANASKAIDILLAIKGSGSASSAAQHHNHTSSTKTYTKLEAGYYHHDNKVYKVVVSPQTGNTYAKVFIPDNGWIYAQGAVKTLAQASAPALTLEEAKKYGRIYGVCIVCSRTLTDEESIAAGIGPICAGKF
jgi:hypothetical protein